jgi:hypothetical protein
MLGGSMPRLVQVAVVGGVLSRLTEKSLRVMAGNPTREDLTRLADLVVAGEITAMIDRGYSLDEVPEALKYLGEGYAKGSSSSASDCEHAKSLSDLPRQGRRWSIGSLAHPVGSANRRRGFTRGS